MENATKALLIAAAVLVAILVISLGLVIYNQSAETIQNLNMSDTEIKAFNDQFTRFEGSSKAGSDVNALMQVVLDNNMKYRGDTNKLVTVTVTGDPDINSGADKVLVTKTTRSTPTRVQTGKRYKVEASYNGTTKLVTDIKCTMNT